MYLLTLDKFLESNKKARCKTSFLKQFLPIRPSKSLAEIAAALMTDGHLELHKGIRPKKIVFYSDSMESLRWFNQLVRKVFSTRGKIVEYVPYYGFERNTKRYKAIVNNAAIARVLLMLGVPGGDKTKQAFDVPDWIKKSSKHLKKAFLQRLFDFDGSIPVKKKGRKAAWSIQFFTVKHRKYMNSGEAYCASIIELLKEFRVDARLCTYQKDAEKFVFIITAVNQKSILNFAKNIGYKDTTKQGRLNRAVQNILANISFKDVKIKKLLGEFKECTGTDKASIVLINRSTGTDYTKRQFEHWRRGEIKTPLPVIKFVCKSLEYDIKDFVGNYCL